MPETKSAKKSAKKEEEREREREREREAAQEEREKKKKRRRRREEEEEPFTRIVSKSLFSFLPPLFFCFFDFSFVLEEPGKPRALVN